MKAYDRKSYDRGYEDGRVYSETVGELRQRLAEAEELLVQAKDTCSPWMADRIDDFFASACPRCHGTGAIDAATSEVDPTCPECDGEGKR